MTFKVEVEGLPAMYMDGNSPGQVKTHLRKLIKQPSMIKSVDRMTKHDVKKTYRAKAQGKEVDEGLNELSPDTVKSYKKAASKSNYAAAQKYARVAGSPTSRKYKNKEMDRLDNIGRKRKAGLAMADKKEGSCGDVDYGSDKSIKIMKKKTPGEAQEGNGLWANIHAKRRRGEKMRKKGAKGAPTAADIKSAQKEDVTEKLTIGKIRRAAYKTGKVLGDVNAVKKGKVAKRVKNRVVGKMLGKAVGKLGLFK